MEGAAAGLESIAAISDASLTQQDPGAEPEELRAQRVDTDFFQVLRVQPVRGRAFETGDAVDGRARVAITSYGFWQRRFGADPEVIGQTIPLDDGSYEVIGVMPPEFAYPVAALRPTELWVPLVIPPDDRIRNPTRRAFYLSVIPPDLLPCSVNTP